MSTTTTDALASAIKSLDATEVAPGKYAHRDDTTRRYYIVSAADMERLPEYLLDDPAQGYSGWCADTPSAEMATWWTPEERFAYAIVVADPAGWEESCPDWRGVFFGLDDQFYSDSNRAPVYVSEADAKARLDELNVTGDWETHDGDDVRPQYRIVRITADLETGEEIEA